LVGLKPAAAIGSASSIRWQGEAEGVTDAPAAELEPPRLNPIRAIPSWLFSLVIHLVLLVMLALLTGPVGQDIGRVLLTIGQSEGTSEGELAEFAIDTQSQSIEEIDSAELETPVDVQMPDLSLANIESTQPSFTLETSMLGVGDPSAPALPMVGGRSGTMKKTLLMLYGGTPMTESAVGSGLAWLARQQSKDGSWSIRGPYNDGGTIENKPAATAMAMLAFMGAGNTHLDGEYAETMQRAVKWLVKQQDRNGFFASTSRDHQQAYSQAQSSIAICELYAMTKDSWLRGPAQLAVDCAEEWQAPEGGWRYQPRFDSDTSITGWFVMTLQSGLAAGLEVDRAVLYRVSDFLDSVQSYDGAAYSYQPRGAASQAMTAEGLLCRQYLGWRHDHPALLRGVDAMANEYGFNIQDTDFYYWYYATQVLHHFGGEPWKVWNNEMREKLPAAQVRRGSESGSWSPQSDRWGGTGGRLYTTCMAIYCLEVYYRHMPLYKTAYNDAAIPDVESVVD